MSKYIFIFCLALIISSCKNEKQSDVTTETTVVKEVSIAEKIANAHGYDHWDVVTEIQFTFNVDKDSTHFERQWKWFPKENKVELIKNTENTISYNRNAVDSLAMTIDKGFINDKYWLLAPFNLVWDEGTSVSEPTKEVAPISNNTLNKITLTYSNNGGYTPGDAYDIFYGDDYLIKEWIYRRGNSAEPTMATTWEDYETFGGLKIAKSHKKSGENWNLNFTNIKVISKSL
ncbi:hypothetical protein ES677_08050 [Bizionia gelidisalsuginis]|uniref:Selenophosphate synthetase n=2 Tax=Bizionia TaxID=283785 RepID=A0A8H2QJ64_9FLAO|nr:MULTISPECIES: hypothetical protein [Bizionia]TYB73929.1 hypothetical protein ES676_09300 [Bizionia saleffrena]TYC12892.1 hypothetical protein ES677_08050 [Bizionia gelidisalsuginis]